MNEFKQQEAYLKSLFIYAKSLKESKKRADGLVAHLSRWAVHPVKWLARRGRLTEKEIVNVVDRSAYFTKVYYEDYKFYCYERGELCIFMQMPRGMTIEKPLPPAVPEILSEREIYNESIDTKEKFIEAMMLKARKISRTKKFEYGLVGRIKDLPVFPVSWLAEYGDLNEDSLREAIDESHLFTKVWYEGNKFYSYQRGDLCIYRFKPPGLVINGFPEKTKASKQDLIFEIIDLKRQIEELKK